MAARESIALIEKGANRLAFSGVSGAFEAAIALPPYPHEMARDPGGRTAYAAITAPRAPLLVAISLIYRRSSDGACSSALPLCARCGAVFSTEEVGQPNIIDLPRFEHAEARYASKAWRVIAILLRA